MFAIRLKIPHLVYQGRGQSRHGSKTSDVARAHEVVGHKPKVRVDAIFHIKTDFVRLQILCDFENSIVLFKKRHYRV